MFSSFDAVQFAPIIEVAHLSDMCKLDHHKHKVDLTLGVYRNYFGQPEKLSAVRKVEIDMANDEQNTKDYLPITGLAQFCCAGLQLLLGHDHPAISAKKADAIQTVGGSGGVILGALFLRKLLNFPVAYISDPSWPSHRGMCDSAGFIVKKYTYWDSQNNTLDFKGMLQDLSLAPEKSVVILHACAHNPTGMDLSREDWKKLADLMKTRKLFPLFDIAYQGFASGDLDEDAWVIRMFLGEGFELFAAQSFSKNFGLYNDRVGNLVFVTNDAEATARTKSQLMVLARYCWSSPPKHGACIVSTILNDSDLRTEWQSNLKDMTSRIIKTRQLFYEKLKALGTSGNLENIINQRGMFSYTGLSPEHTNYLRTHYHIYMPSDGRINICGLNFSNLDYVANAFHETLLRSTAGDTKI